MNRKELIKRAAPNAIYRARSSVIEAANKALQPLGREVWDDDTVPAPSLFNIHTRTLAVALPPHLAVVPERLAGEGSR